MHLNDSLTQKDKKILENSVVFKGMLKNDMNHFFDACQVQVYHPGQAILTLGDKGDGLYIILEGKAEVFVPQGDLKKNKKPKEGCKARIDTLKSGICFGEYSLVDQKKVSASVSALTEARMFYLPTEDFFRISGMHLRIENIIYKNILKLLISRCREANQEMEDDVFLIY